MALDERTCPTCLVHFIPRRIDQIFHERPCRDEVYDAEYLSLFDQFPRALALQGYECFFGCGAKAPDLKPLFTSLPSKEQLVASCAPCKTAFYQPTTPSQSNEHT